jgi:hypothetical protein
MHSAGSKRLMRTCRRWPAECERHMALNDSWGQRLSVPSPGWTHLRRLDRLHRQRAVFLSEGDREWLLSKTAESLFFTRSRSLRGFPSQFRRR